MSEALTNSKRVLHSASYVAAELTAPEQREAAAAPSRGLEKLNFLRQLGVTARELERARSMTERGDDVHDVLDLATRLTDEEEGGWNLALAARAAVLPADAFVGLSDVVAEIRGAPIADVMSFKQRMRTAPVGRLHLERIEMYPAGTEQGELVFTVPLAPEETVRVSHKEWAVSGEEYENIVQDFFESYSERGVAEKTDVAMSAENDSRHANSFNFSSSASGGYGPVSVTVSVGLTQSSENRQALKESVQRSREITEKASARTRKEHKVSAKLETERGVEETALRTITNPHSDKALRVDYFRLMRKWRMDLYRYGLRLTFDIPVPNPGARLWGRHRRLAELDARIRVPFSFDLAIRDVTRANWRDRAAEYQAVVEPPPPERQSVSITKQLTDPNGGHEVFEFVAPPGTRMKAGALGTGVFVGPGIPFLYTQDPDMTMQVHPIAGTGDGRLELKTDSTGSGDRTTVLVIYGHGGWRISLTLVAGAEGLPQLFDAWQVKAWQTLRDAALQRHTQRLARLHDERELLWSQLSGGDTLMLRRMEREELIRSTLLWMIGPSFDATPADVGKVIRRIVDREEHDKPDDSPGAALAGKLSSSDWALVHGFGDHVKFLHHAIEWENLLYFLYPYFWGSDDVAREKLLFDHPDPNHRDFLRAGWARVVVPIRPGFERDLTELLEKGKVGGSGTSPYLTIADEVAAYANTNYRGIPPANPERHARPLLYPQQRRTWDAMTKAIKAIEDHHRNTGSYPADLGVLPGHPFTDAWGRPLVYTVPGSGNDYDLLSYGADGEEGGEGLDADISAAASASLVATWSDYTPTSGIDIELTGKPINV